MDRPIYDETCERMMIGIICATAGDALDTSEIAAEHFFHFATRLVFETVEKLRADKKSVDLISISQFLSVGDAERIGAANLAEMCQWILPHHALQIVEKLNGLRVMRKVQETMRWADCSMNAGMSGEEAESFFGEFSRRTASIEIVNESENLLPVCVKAIGERLDRMDRGEKLMGLSTGIEAWNMAFGGLVEGQMYGLAGRPATGKTSLMEQFIAEMLSRDDPVLVFEKDMSPQKLVERMACREMKVPYWRFVKNLTSPQQRSELRSIVSALGESPFYVYSPVGLTAERMCSIVRREKRIHGIKAVFLDHVQALSVGKDMREGLTQASLTIRRNVTETNIPHVILAHLNREGGIGRPSPNNIKEFDQLFGDVDGLVMLWSDQAASDVPKGEMRKMKFLVAKNRDGAESEDDILFDGQILKFVNAIHEK